MAMLLFLLSPLINLIIQKKKVLFCAGLLLPISMIIHRPLGNINVLHSLVYFLPVYLLGIYCCNHHQKISAYLKDNQRKLILALLAILIGIAQITILHHAGNFHKEFWLVTVPDINLVQKIIFCFLFLSILDLYEEQDIPVIKKTADTSFAIYFIHPFVISILQKIVALSQLDFEGNFFTLILATFLTIFGSLAIASLIKTVFKKNSRYLIGY